MHLPRFFVVIALAFGPLVGCQKKAPPPAQAAAVPVSVESVEVGLIDAPRTLQLTGTLKGAKETDLAANVAGQVLQTNVERGQSVKDGELLATVDVRSAALALEEARVQVESSKTQVEISQRDCERYEKLKESGAVTAFEYDQVTSKCKTAPFSVRAAQARQSIAAKTVGDGKIRAPFTGIVTQRYVEVGEYVLPSSRVVSIAQIDDLLLVFSLPERNWTDVQQDAPVSFRVAAYRDERFDGKVVHITNAVRETRDVVVEAAVVNTDRKLLPGMFASIELTIGHEKLPAIPVTSVFEANGKENVMVVTGSALEQRVVQLAPAIAGQRPVLTGVRAGERVVAQYSDNLENGQPVK